tara:strand:- start:3271 stop:3678 length:408 start_codon:yes stop_codon:yes gene_type:complete
MPDSDGVVSPLIRITETTPSLFERIGSDKILRPLLRYFYSDARQHQIIGPIFLRQIDDWPGHLEKILGFWTTVTGGPISYAGPMMIAHLKLHLKPEHFEIWLDLWRRQCRIRLEPNHAGEVIHIAEIVCKAARLG